MQKNVLKKLFQSHKFDLLLGAVLLIVALCLFPILKGCEKKGGVVTVKSDGEVIDVLSLEKDGEYVYKTFYGTNTLVIEDGQAYVIESSCKDHICEETGKISKVGETIICLPNTFFVTVIEGEEALYDEVVE